MKAWIRALDDVVVFLVGVALIALAAAIGMKIESWGLWQTVAFSVPLGLGVLLIAPRAFAAAVAAVAQLRNKQP